MRTVSITLSGSLLLILVVILLSASLYPLPPPIGGNILDADLPALSPGHLLGTDAGGNDLLARLLHGGRTSLLIAAAVNLLGLLLGGTLGAVGAYLDGVTDTIIMRLLDIFIAFPSLILVLAIAQALGPGELHTICALAFFAVPAFARIARAATLRLREQPFMVAARLCGSSTLKILLGHVAPNILPQLITFALLGMGLVITIEGAVSYLGLGLPLPQPSWGTMIQQGQMVLTVRPLLVLLPGLLLFTTVLLFNMVGEVLRDRWEQQ